MKEREEFLLGEEKTSPVTRTLFVSLDRADAVIDGVPCPRFWRAGLLTLPFSCPLPCYLSVSKPLKVILDIRYQYAIMVSSIRRDSFVPGQPCAPAPQSF